MKSTTDLVNVLNALLLLSIDGNIFSMKQDEQSAVVKRAYRGLSKVLHPDKGGSNKSFRKLVDAKELLLSLISKNSLTSDQLMIDKMKNSYININGIKEGKLLVEISKIVQSKNKIKAVKTTVDLFEENAEIWQRPESEYMFYSLTYSFPLINVPLNITIAGYINMLPGDKVAVFENGIIIKHIQEVTQKDICKNHICTDFGIDLPKFGDIEYGATYELKLNDYLEIHFIFNPVIVV